MSEKPLLKVRDLCIKFGAFEAVRGASFAVQPGESLAVIGESGSGKSVTANAVMGLLSMPPARIERGSIAFEGEELLTMPTVRRRRLLGASLAMIFQDPLSHLNPAYSVGWQVAETCIIHGVPRAEARRRAVELLDQVGIPDPARRAAQFPHEFSGGQRQRIMIAMAMAMRPKLLIADEPTTALDVTVQGQILDLLGDLQRAHGTALIMITHDLSVASRIANRAIVMRRGEIVEEGTMRQVLNAPRHAYTQQLVSARQDVLNTSPVPVSPPLIELRNATICYGRHVAVRGVSLSARPGEILCIVGESGSGKSTVANAMLGLLPLAGGQALFNDRSIADLRGAELRQYRRAVQAVFQDPYSSLNPRMSVEAVLSEPWTLHPDIVALADRRKVATDLIESVGLSADDLSKHPGNFSGGQRQRIAIARALALSSQIVVCDEAVSSLDMTVQAQIIGLLAELRHTRGIGFVFITHDLGLVRTFADRVIVMKSGEIVEEALVGDLFGRPRHAYTRQLIEASLPVAVETS